jgi:hypothetical protein
VAEGWNSGSPVTDAAQPRYGSENAGFVTGQTLHVNGGSYLA